MRTLEEIYNEMVAQYEESAGLVMEKGGDMSLRMYVMAAQIFALENQLEFSLRQAYPQSAEGEYLDSHAAVRGIARGEASRANGNIRFYVEEAAETPITVAEGVVCTDAVGTEFITLVSGTIAAGSLYCDVEAAAVLAGETGNVPAGAVCHMPLAPVGVAGCRNTAAFAGGSAGESDESLRARVLSSYSSLPNGANAAYYEQQALAVDGVYAVQVLPRKRGLGTVDVVVASKEGLPDQTTLSRVKGILDAQREICVDIAVYGPEIKPVNIEIELASGDFAAAKAAVEKALGDYFTGALLGKGLMLAHIGNAVYKAKGVDNYHILSPQYDMAAAEGVLPVLGSVTVKEMGA